MITFLAPKLKFISSTKKTITKKEVVKDYYNYLFYDTHTGASTIISDWSTDPFNDVLEPNHSYQVTGFINTSQRGNFLVIKEITEV